MIDGIIKTAFFEGNFLSRKESENLLATLVDVEGGIQDYDQILVEAKRRLAGYEIVDGTVLLVRTNTRLSDAVRLMMVRIINIARKRRYIVVINDEVCYKPAWIRGASDADVASHVKAAYIVSATKKTPSLMDRLSLQFSLYRHVWSTAV